MNGAFSVKVRRLILDRDECCCVNCGVLVANPMDYSPLREYSLQHRRARGAGGSRDKATSSPANGCVLCGDGVSGCHGEAESQPLWAASLGYRVAQGSDPATIPMRHAAHGWVLLDAFGGVVSQEVTW